MLSHGPTRHPTPGLERETPRGWGGSKVLWDTGPGSRSNAKLCLTLCDSKNWSMPGFPVLHGVCSNSCPLSWWYHPTLRSLIYNSIRGSTVRFTEMQMITAENQFKGRRDSESQDRYVQNLAHQDWGTRFLRTFSKSLCWKYCIISLISASRKIEQMNLCAKQKQRSRRREQMYGYQGGRGEVWWIERLGLILLRSMH